MSANNQNLPLSKRESTINGDDDRSQDSYGSDIDPSSTAKEEFHK